MERFIVGLSRQQKAQLAALSKTRGQSMAGLVRRAVERLAEAGAMDADQELLLERHIDELNAAIDRADVAVDAARAEVARVRRALQRARRVEAKRPSTRKAA